ncbi:TonB-dependent receptor [Mucilaginibacter ginkgonis]|uniref:Carboxypeptidase regulatory-like domain-containing protein n=1 Tax=Mucilaginibacter ginkgonis TaxID=2682091 RepID=A0A6I4IPG3_9SPHI|nr:carboxypeptidase regulatory-like domain-containing protein [Mucilaginibacter ginkgonis]QQL49230.1 carboxypeptidase regulatory-like domain-containing protein [Mucilaginibacter ginkgonis]
MRKFLLIILALIAVATTQFKANAQGVTTASLNGIVSDSKGPIPGATVTATHTPTGTVYTAVSRADGRYNIPNLRVGGPYTVKVSFIGYSTFQQDNLTLNIGQDQRIDAPLQENNIALKEVKVTGTGSKVINSSRTGARETVTRSQIDNLPTVNRSLNDFTSLTPSANGQNFGGRSSTFNNLTVDGALFNNSFGLSSTLGGQTSSQPISLDAIDQIQVDIAPFDVRQGNFTGAGINTVLKSGTNTVKGTVYDFIRGTGLTGYKAGDVTIAKTPFTYRSTGVAIGGPIIKNKLFLFVSGEQERIQRPANSYVAAGSGADGSASNVNASTLNDIANTLKTKYGYDPGPYQQFNFATYSDKATVKLDWNIDKNNVLSAKYFYLKSYADQPPSNSGITNGGVGYGTTRAAGPNTLPFFGAGYRINNNFNIGIIELDSKFSNKVSNKLTVGYSALRDFRAFSGSSTIPMVDIGNGTTTAAGVITTAPSATLTSFGSELYTAGNLLSTNITQFSDDVSIFAGAHEITIGTNNQIQSYVNGFAPDYNGLYTYASASDFINGLPAQAYTYRNSALPDGSFPYAKIKAAILSLYAQDKWHATDNLRITYGLRADYDIFPTSLASNPNAAALTFQGGYPNGIQVDPSKLPNNRVLLSPRVGFNWDIFGDQTTQLRGGTGIFTGLIPFVWISNQASNNGLLFGSGTVTKAATPNDPRLIFNPNVDANRPASTAANTSYELDVTDPNLKYPQIFRTNLAVDQRLPWGIIGTIEGAYTKDINAIYHQNLVLSNAYATLPGVEGQIRYASRNITPSAASPQSATNPAITGLYYMTNSSKGYSYFVTAQLQKSFANGLYANIAYTHSGAKDVNDGGSTASTIWSTRYVANDPNANVVSNSSYVMPNRVIATAYYKLNEGKIGTTTVGFKFEMANSGAVSYITSGDPNNDGATNDLMYIPRNQSDIILVKNSATDTRTTDQIWQQLDAFISQDKYLNSHRGQFAERNGVILPYFKRLDFHAAQDIFIQTGKVKNTLQVTFDVINFTNLLNKNWGLYQNSYSGFGNGATTVLRYAGLDAATGRATYAFPQLTGSATGPTQSFINDTSAGSRWYAQIGLRYIFN